MQARAEAVRNFNGAKRSAGGGDDVEKDLEPLRGKLGCQLLETVPADHEEAAHGIGDADLQQAFGDPGCKQAEAGPLLVETISAAALDIAAADGEICLPVLQRGQHLWQLRFIVLQVGIHHGHEGGARCQNAFDAGSGEPAASNSPDTAGTRVLCGKTAHDIGGAIRRIIVDEYDFPIDAGQCAIELLEQFRDVHAFVERGHDDRKQWDMRRGFGARLEINLGNWNDMLVHGRRIGESRMAGESRIVSELNVSSR